MEQEIVAESGFTTPTKPSRYSDYGQEFESEARGSAKVAAMIFVMAIISIGFLLLAVISNKQGMADPPF